MKTQDRHVIAWLESCAAHLIEQQDFLTVLDRDIDDADHGLSMNRGFSVVKTTLPDIERQHIGNILRNTGMKLLSSVGGASGPLYGTLFTRAFAAMGARIELTLEEWLAYLEEGIAGVIAWGKAEQGDKTLCDVWAPVLHEARKNLQAGMSPSLLLSTTVQDAATAVDNTINIQAKRGRAGCLDARSVGHQDPGATSSWLMIKAMQEGLTGQIMVATVIIPHNLRLAQGIEELALQMSGGDVSLATAAGIDDPQNPIGIDAIAIISTIESVRSPDGVLVLMDMDSALLSTEMALELLSEEQRSAIYLLAAPVVEGAMSAVTLTAAGFSVMEIIVEVDFALCAKQQQLVPSPPAGEAIPVISSVNHSGERQTFCWAIYNPHGIYARPAISILKVSARYSTNIIVIKGDKYASTRSLNEPVMLGVRYGDEIIFQAEGTDVSDTLKAIRTLAKDHFGEAHLLASLEIPLTEAPAAGAPVDGAISDLSVQNGIVIGPVEWFTCERPEITQRIVDPPREELSRIESAIDIVACELADKAAGPEGDVFAVHKMMLEDPKANRQLQQRLVKGKQAEFTWLKVMQALVEQYCQAETLYLHEREADIRDLIRQVPNQLCGVSG